MAVGFFKKSLILVAIALVSISSSLKVLFLVFQRLRDQDAAASKIIHHWARNILKILQVNYTVLNSHNFSFVSDRPYIIMSNHCSHVDIPLIYEAFAHDKIGMIAKKELFKIPLFGRGMKLGGCLSIDRDNMRQALKDMDIAKKRLLSGVRLWIAPEGTRSLTGELGVLKKGGFKIAVGAKAIIIPVVIIGSNRILPAKTMDFNLEEKVEVHIGQPIDTLDYDTKDLQLLMEKVSRSLFINS